MEEFKEVKVMPIVKRVLNKCEGHDIVALISSPDPTFIVNENGEPVGIYHGGHNATWWDTPEAQKMKKEVEEAWKNNLEKDE